MTEISPRLGSYSQHAEIKDPAVWKASQDLEASFLAEMLKSIGMEGSQSEFGGGMGEEQFASFMREAQAQKMVQSGGIGLADAFYISLMKEKTGG